MKYPIMVAPSAAKVPLHPDGEIGMHRGATAASNTPMILSHNTSTAVDTVAGGAKGRCGGSSIRSRTATAGREDSRRAQAAGCTAIVVTVDQQASYYERTAAGSESRRQHRGAGRARRRSRPAPADGWGRRCIACRRAGSGTRGSISTRFARSSRCRCS